MNRVLRLGLQAAALLVGLAVVALCILCAVFSFVNLWNSSRTPAAKYGEKRVPRAHLTPGLVFVGRELEYQKCERFNFTSLNWEKQPKLPMKPPQRFALPPRQAIRGFQHLHVTNFFQQVDEGMKFFLVPGPSEWVNKDTVYCHIAVPANHQNVWVFVDADYDQLQSRFAVATLETAFASEKWQLAMDVFARNSINLVSTSFASFYLMTKRNFKEFGEKLGAKVEVEISLVEHNMTIMNSTLKENGYDPEEFQHIEVFYQWKDGKYEEGDKFYSVTMWTIVTVMASSLLMVERAYFTLVKAIKMTKAKDPVPQAHDQSQNENVEPKGAAAEGGDLGEYDVDEVGEDENQDDDDNMFNDDKLDQPEMV